MRYGLIREVAFDTGVTYIRYGLIREVAFDTGVTL
jgi:hypothetical protein